MYSLFHLCSYLQNTWNATCLERRTKCQKLLSTLFVRNEFTKFPSTKYYRFSSLNFIDFLLQIRITIKHLQLPTVCRQLKCLIITYVPRQVTSCYCLNIIIIDNRQSTNEKYHCETKQTKQKLKFETHIHVNKENTLENT